MLKFFCLFSYIYTPGLNVAILWFVSLPWDVYPNLQYTWAEVKFFIIDLWSSKIVDADDECNKIYVIKTTKLWFKMK